MYQEIRDGRATQQGGLFIEMAHLGGDRVRQMFPGMVKRCEDCGFDLATGRVEVVPTAHYMMGGVQMEIDCTTTTPGLFVAGEDAGGVHGANRLGGNGVANSTVFGAIAGDEMAAAVGRGLPLTDPDPEFVEQAIARAEKPFGQTKADLSELRERLWSLMWDKVGILRTAHGIREGIRGLDDCRATLAGMGVEDDDRAFNLTWHDWLNLDNQITVSQAIAGASLARDDSRGAHFREDCPTTGNLEQSAYTCTRVENGQLIQEMTPVAFTMVKPGESLIDGEAGAPRATQNGDPS